MWMGLKQWVLENGLSSSHTAPSRSIIRIGRQTEVHLRYEQTILVCYYLDLFPSEKKNTAFCDMVLQQISKCIW